MLRGACPAIPIGAKTRYGPLGNQPDGAASAAVTAIRSTVRHELLPPEGDDPVAALSGYHLNLNLINHGIYSTPG